MRIEQIARGPTGIVGPEANEQIFVLKRLFIEAQGIGIAQQAGVVLSQKVHDIDVNHRRIKPTRSHQPQVGKIVFVGADANRAGSGGFIERHGVHIAFDGTDGIASRE